MGSALCPITQAAQQCTLTLGCPHRTDHVFQDCIRAHDNHFCSNYYRGRGGCDGGRVGGEEVEGGSLNMANTCTYDEVQKRLDVRTNEMPYIGLRCTTAYQRRALLAPRHTSPLALQDARVLRDDNAFPHAHITVDPWHFNTRFAKTLNKQGDAGPPGHSSYYSKAGSNISSSGSGSDSGVRPIWRDVHYAFNRAMYKNVVDSKTELVDRMHAEPEEIIAAVDALLLTHSHRGSRHTGVITKATQDWWSRQIKDIRESRILSNPHPNTPDAGRMSSSVLENYHRQLYRLVKVVQVSKAAMRAFLAEVMFRWNTDCRRRHKLEYDWALYDILLLHSTATAATTATAAATVAALRLARGQQPVGDQRTALIHQLAVDSELLGLNSRRQSTHIPCAALTAAAQWGDETAEQPTLTEYVWMRSRAAWAFAHSASAVGAAVSGFNEPLRLLLLLRLLVVVVVVVVEIVITANGSRCCCCCCCSCCCICCSREAMVCIRLRPGRTAWSEVAQCDGERAHVCRLRVIDGPATTMERRAAASPVLLLLLVLLCAWVGAMTWSSSSSSDTRLTEGRPCEHQCLLCCSSHLSWSRSVRVALLLPLSSGSAWMAWKTETAC